MVTPVWEACRINEARRNKRMGNVLGGRQRQQEAQSFVQHISTAWVRTWPVRTGGSRQVRPERVKWTRYGQPYSFHPIFLFFSVMTDVYSHGSLLTES